MKETTSYNSLRGVVDVYRRRLAAFLFVTSMIALAAAVVTWMWNETVVKALSIANVINYHTALKALVALATLAIILIVIVAALSRSQNKRKKRLLE